MILDLERFVTEERPHWERLEGHAARNRKRPGAQDAARAKSWPSTTCISAAPPTSQRSRHSPASSTFGATSKESSRAPMAKFIHSAGQQRRLHVWKWFTQTFPRTFRAPPRALLALRGSNGRWLHLRSRCLEVRPRCQAHHHAVSRLERKPIGTRRAGKSPPRTTGLPGTRAPSPPCS